MRRALASLKEPLADHVPTGASILIPEVMVLPKLGYSVLMTGDPLAIVNPYRSLTAWCGLEWDAVVRSLKMPQKSDGWAPRAILSHGALARTAPLWTS